MNLLPKFPTTFFYPFTEQLKNLMEQNGAVYLHLTGQRYTIKCGSANSSINCTVWAVHLKHQWAASLSSIFSFFLGSIGRNKQ
jgi:hypothetical protein